MPFLLTDADKRKLVGVNVRLVAVITQLALVSPTKFIVVEGVRTKARQRELVAQRKSKTMDSKHLIGRAVDVAPIVNGAVSWDWNHFTPIIDACRHVARDLDTPLTFGYDWGWDAPHIEMEEP